MKTIFYSNVHFDGGVYFRGNLITVDPNVFLSHHILHSTRYGNSEKVAKFYVDSVISLILLFYVFEIEVKVLGVLQLARRGKFLTEGEKFVMIAAIKVHLCSQVRVRMPQSLTCIEI